MDLHEKQQFDFLLMTAAERFSERLIQRNAGAENALKKLRHDPQSEGVWLDDFVKVLFQDFLLDNTAGACFILEALEKRVVVATSGGKVAEVLQALSQRAFADLLKQKLEETLEQNVMYRN